MTTQEKKDRIKLLVSEMLHEAMGNMSKNIDKALNSGAIDFDNWSEDNKPMILPKCIVTAIIQQESTQYDGKGTSYEKEIKREVANIKYFI